MNKEILREWIQVLRTTDKEQGYRAFMIPTDNAPLYCSLGILCHDVLNIEPELQEFFTTRGNIDYRFSFKGCSHYLSISILDSIGAIHSNLELLFSRSSFERAIKESEDFRSGAKKFLDVSAPVFTYFPMGQEFRTFAIVSLNDTYKLTFKEIAAFLEYADKVN